MILNKRNSQSARWDKENNKWLVGTEEYQWYHERTQERSPWMNLDDALLWIRKRDQEKNFESCNPAPENKILEKRV